MKQLFTILFFLLCLTGECFAQNKSSYKVGDYYNDGTKEGVVFYVDATGKHGKIVSLDQDEFQWCTKAQYDKEIVVGATSKTDGKANTDKVMARADRAEYPAFVWCRNKGKDWYLPAIDELKLLLLNDSVYDAVNKTLESQGEMKMDKAMYLSSTEWDKLCVLRVYKRFGNTLDGDKDYSSCRVRAVANFKLDANAATNTPAQKVGQTPKRTTATTITTAKTYKVGDYYNDGTKEGVVFWVDETGRHGKIVSHKQVRLQWCTEAQYDKKIVVGATSKTDGKANTDKVMARADRAEYPAFVWSRNKGKDWYLPAIEELELLLLNDSVRNAVNKTLESRGAMRMKSGYFYWSSTESWNISATAVNMIDGSTDWGTRNKDYYVCAVATFDLGTDTPAKSKSDDVAIARADKRAVYLMEYANQINRKDYISPREAIYTPMAMFVTRDIPMDAVQLIMESAKGVKKSEIANDKFDSKVSVTPEGFYLRVRGYEAMPCRYMSVSYDNDNLSKIASLYFSYAMPKGWKKGDIAKYATAISEDINRLGVQMKKRSWSGGSTGYQGYHQGHTISIMYSTKYIKYSEPTISILITYDEELK